MRQPYDEYFSSVARLRNSDLSPKERLDSLNRLRKALEDWGTWTWDDVSFEWHINLEDYHILPFPGAWSDQPRYVQQELHQWNMIRRFHELNEQLPDASGFPTLDELLRNGHK